MIINLELKLIDTEYSKYLSIINLELKLIDAEYSLELNLDTIQQISSIINLKLKLIDAEYSNFRRQESRRH